MDHPLDYFTPRRAGEQDPAPAATCPSLACCQVRLAVASNCVSVRCAPARYRALYVTITLR
jgi:hypothetical protein